MEQLRRRPIIGIFLSLVPLVLGSAAAESTNLLLISVDTLRADNLSCYGYPYPVSPHIDQLAKKGILFEDTITAIGKTGPSFTSLFTSLYPPTHGARRNGVPVRPDVPVLAEILHQSGYDTAAFISNWTLRSNLSALDRGFDHWDQEFNKQRYGIGPAERDAAHLTAAVLDWIKSSRKPTPKSVDRPTAASEPPLFLWVHYSDPHTPYDLRKGFEVPKPPIHKRLTKWQKRWRYASEVRYTDYWIGELLAGLKPYLDERQTLLVFLSDHGESIGEHGYWGHGKNTHWPNLDVPLVLVGPGLPKNVRSRAPASLVDVMPTVLELLEVEPPADLAGTSLLDAVRGLGKQPHWRFAFGDRHTALGKGAKRNFENPLEIAVVSDTVKAVYDFQKQTVSYFDLTRDANELNPLERPPSTQSQKLPQLLASWYRGLPKYEAKSGELSPEDVEQLEALGYVEAP